jgi:nicotinate-nucleotide adenylyltransferase
MDLVDSSCDRIGMSSEETDFLTETRLGALGGSFNPIHFGHLFLARRIRDLFRLQRVHFIVAAVPPHKPAEVLAPFIHRYAMVSLALAGARDFVPSPVELEPPPSPFSVHTLEKLDQRNRGEHARVFFIAGGDSLLDVGEWHESKRLLASHDFIFVMRPGVDIPDPAGLLPSSARGSLLDLRDRRPAEIRAAIRVAEGGWERRVYLLDVGAPDISASTIRQHIAAGRAVDNLVPARVREYIDKLQIYGE